MYVPSSWERPSSRIYVDQYPRFNSPRLVHLGGAFLRKRIAVLVETVLWFITYVAAVPTVQSLEILS